MKMNSIQANIVEHMALQYVQIVKCQPLPQFYYDYYCIFNNYQIYHVAGLSLNTLFYILTFLAVLPLSLKAKRDFIVQKREIERNKIQTKMHQWQQRKQ